MPIGATTAAAPLPCSCAQCHISHLPRPRAAADLNGLATLAQRPHTGSEEPGLWPLSSSSVGLASFAGPASARANKKRIAHTARHLLTRGRVARVRGFPAVCECFRFLLTGAPLPALFPSWLLSCLIATSSLAFRHPSHYPLRVIFFFPRTVTPLERCPCAAPFERLLSSATNSWPPSRPLLTAVAARRWRRALAPRPWRHGGQQHPSHSLRSSPAPPLSNVRFFSPPL